MVRLGGSGLGSNPNFQLFMIPETAEGAWREQTRSLSMQLWHANWR